MAETKETGPDDDAEIARILAMLRVGSGDYKGFVLHIMDLNPEQHTRWALSRWELLRIGWGLIRSAMRRPA